MNVNEIVEQYLGEHGFDGLYNTNMECSCLKDALWPCDYPNGDCKAGVRIDCPGSECDGYGVKGHFHIGEREAQ